MKFNGGMGEFAGEGKRINRGKIFAAALCLFYLNSTRSPFPGRARTNNDIAISKLCCWTLFFE